MKDLNLIFGRSLKITVRYVVLFLVLISFKGLYAQEELNAYLKTGAENNPGLKAQFASYNATLERIPQVGSLPDLSVSFGYFISPIETRLGPQQAKISVAQMFPWFGTLNAQENVFVERAKMDFEAFEEAKSELFFEIKSAYFDLYFIQKGIDITKENISILNTFQELALIKIETGKSSVVDEMRVEMELNELENQLAYLIDNKWTLEVKFHKLLNDFSDETIRVPDVLWEEELSKDKAELLSTITQKNHLIKQIEYETSSWESEGIAARKTGAPKISVGIDYSFIGKSSLATAGSESGRDAFMPMIGISIPLYRKKYNSMVKEAAFKVEASEFKKAEQKNELTILFEKGYRDYKDANRRIELAQKQLKLAEKSLSILMVAYSSEGIRFEEVLRMERKVLKYGLELNKARADKNASVAFISYLSGQ